MTPIPSLPAIAWKYLAPSTAEKVLGNRTLRFSPLNDRQAGSVVPVLNDRCDCVFDFTDEVALILRGKTVVDRNRPGVVRDPEDTPERTIEKSLRQQLRENGLRILSLSLTDPTTRAANPLWAYYGASSQGVCVEIDGAALMKVLSEELKSGEKLGFATPWQARRVVYHDTLPKYPSKSLGPAVAANRLVEAIFRKDTGWSHEDEFRLVIAVDQDAPDKSILKLPLYTWTFPKGIVTRIHLGEYCSTETIEMVNRLADGIPVRRHY